MRKPVSTRKNVAKQIGSSLKVTISNSKNIDTTESEKLIESEIRYRRLFETAKDGILILDFKTGRIVDANPYIIEIIDLPLKEILKKKLWEIGLFSNRKESELAFEELKRKSYIRFEDMPIKRQDGTIKEVEFVSNVYFVNKLKVIQCNIRDITARRIAENALKESEQHFKTQSEDYQNLNRDYLILNEQLIESLHHIQNINYELIAAKVKSEESDALKSSFLANISHEIRTPLNAMMGFSEFLLEPGLSHQRIEENIQIIRSSSLQLLSIINDIIDISKIEAGQLTIYPEIVDVNRLINELFVQYKKSAGLKRPALKLSTRYTDQPIKIKTDRNRIKQVICNLLDNSIKFTKEGSIEFGYRIKENFIEFYVKDSGIGIAPENKELIFSMFRQVEISNSRSYGGNGLGLSISKALVESLGGIISVESEIGKGSTFVFTIPLFKEFEPENVPLKPVLAIIS